MFVRRERLNLRRPWRRTGQLVEPMFNKSVRRADQQGRPRNVLARCFVAGREHGHAAFSRVFLRVTIKSVPHNCAGESPLCVGFRYP